MTLITTYFTEHIVAVISDVLASSNVEFGDGLTGNIAYREHIRTGERYPLFRYGLVQKIVTIGPGFFMAYAGDLSAASRILTYTQACVSQTKDSQIDFRALFKEISSYANRNARRCSFIMYRLQNGVFSIAGNHFDKLNIAGLGTVLTMGSGHSSFIEFLEQSRERGQFNVDSNRVRGVNIPLGNICIRTFLMYNMLTTIGQHDGRLRLDSRFGFAFECLVKMNGSLQRLDRVLTQGFYVDNLMNGDLHIEEMGTKVFSYYVNDFLILLFQRHASPSVVSIVPTLRSFGKMQLPPVHLTPETAQLTCSVFIDRKSGAIITDDYLYNEHGDLNSRVLAKDFNDFTITYDVERFRAVLSNRFNST